MIGLGAAALLALVLGASEAAPRPGPIQYAQLTIRHQIAIRLRQFAPGVAGIEWKEGRGPRCVPASAIAAAALLSENSVDLILRDRRRIRAKLERCPELDYYFGFYITPNPDGQVCADRDTIRSRVGGQCGIQRFRALQAVRRD